MSDILNATFADLLDVAYHDGAGLVKWGGDAVLLVFDGPDGDDLLRVVDEHDVGAVLLGGFVDDQERVNRRTVDDERGRARRVEPDALVDHEHRHRHEGVVGPDPQVADVDVEVGEYERDSAP